jgi:hypothetical protein
LFVRPPGEGFFSEFRALKRRSEILGSPRPGSLLALAGRDAIIPEGAGARPATPLGGR